MNSTTAGSPDSEHPIDIDLLPAYVNGTLAPADSRRVLAHVRKCLSCRSRLKAWIAISEATKAAFPMPNGTVGNALATVRAALARADSSPSCTEAGDD